jgi:short-subunit dehydrogenase
MTVKSPRSIAVVGATSAIAEQVLRLWLARGGERAVLVGRDAERLERIAADLRVRAPGAAITTVEADLLSDVAISSAVTDMFAAGPIDTVLIAHGSMADQHDAQKDLAIAHATLEATAVSPALWAEAFAGPLGQAGAGSIVILGSVAGDRGRRKNYIYGAAKGLLEIYAQGMRHRFAGTAVRVLLIKPGPTDTPMTADLKASGARMASAMDVAEGIVKAEARGKSVAYVPGLWRAIMFAVRSVPTPVFNRLDF